MRMAKRSRDLGEKPKQETQHGGALGAGGFWGPWVPEKKEGHPQGGGGAGAAKASSSDGFDWQSPRISVFPSVKQKEEQAGVEDEP